MESSKNQPTIPKELLDLEQVIFDIKKENIESSVNRTIDLFDSNNPNSFNSVICLLVISAFMAQRADESIYFDYLLLLQEREEEKHIGNLNVIEIIKKVLVRNKINESYYLLEKMIERNLITTFDVRHVKSNYFIHYFVQRPNKEKIYEDEFYDIFKKDLKIVSKNNWELHKKYVKEGINPSEIAKAIRNDEIEKLQEISSQSDFDFNQTIEPSVYERFSYVNRENVSLIDYAAFFGSIKCFKYLLLNGSNLINTFQFAVAGGNLEIINLCEQNHSDDSGIINAAITFHRNDILRYFYENKFDEVSLNHEEKVNPAENTFLQIIYRLHLNKKSIHKEKEPLVKAIKWSNYEFLEFLKEEEDNLNLGVFPSYCKLSIEMGNLYLLKYFLEIIPIPDDILLWSAISWNAEIIKLFIDKKAFNINETDINFF